MVTSHEGQAARLMTSIVSWQAAHPALNTSIFRLAGISLVPFILALPRPNGSRCQRDGRPYPLEVRSRSSLECELETAARPIPVIGVLHECVRPCPCNREVRRNAEPVRASAGQW